MRYAKSQIAGAGEWAKATDEENEKWNEVATTVETYISELIMGLVTGSKDIADLETYIAEVDELGLADMVAIRQAQYDRYLAAAKG
jgi:putative aldouronate transport system substrate-binding protein